MLFTDQLGRTISLEGTPRRIISLVPSQTELLADLGLESEVVGITKFCIHPENWFRTKTRVGGTKKIDFEKIAALQPDLIIGNKEENEQEQALALMEKYPVWMSDIKTLPDACNMILSIGEITAKKEQSEKIAAKITALFNELKKEFLHFTERKAAYFIWKNPWMAAGHDTFIDHILGICKMKNVFSALPSRYPEVTLHDLQKAQPEIILLSSEPYPFKEKHVEEIRTLLPAAKILLVDGEMFSWYGTRLLHTPEYLRKVLREAGESLS